MSVADITQKLDDDLFSIMLKNAELDQAIIASADIFKSAQYDQEIIRNLEIAEKIPEMKTILTGIATMNPGQKTTATTQVNDLLTIITQQYDAKLIELSEFLRPLSPAARRAEYANIAGQNCDTTPCPQVLVQIKNYLDSKAQTDPELINLRTYLRDMDATLVGGKARSSRSKRNNQLAYW